MESEKELFEEALTYIACQFHLKNERELTWAAQAIQYANPIEFYLKDSYNVKDQLKFELWKFRIEYFIEMKIMLYSQDKSKKIYDFDTRCRTEIKEMEHRIHWLEGNSQGRFEFSEL